MSTNRSSSSLPSSSQFFINMSSLVGGENRIKDMALAEPENPEDAVLLEDENEEEKENEEYEDGDDDKGEDYEGAEEGHKPLKGAQVQFCQSEETEDRLKDLLSPEKLARLGLAQFDNLTFPPVDTALCQEFLSTYHKREAAVKGVSIRISPQLFQKYLHLPLLNEKEARASSEVLSRSPSLTTLLPDCPKTNTKGYYIRNLVKDGEKTHEIRILKYLLTRMYPRKKCEYLAGQFADAFRALCLCIPFDFASMYEDAWVRSLSRSILSSYLCTFGKHITYVLTAYLADHHISIPKSPLPPISTQNLPSADTCDQGSTPANLIFLASDIPSSSHTCADIPLSMHPPPEAAHPFLAECHLPQYTLHERISKEAVQIANTLRYMGPSSLSSMADNLNESLTQPECKELSPPKLHIDQVMSSITPALSNSPAEIMIPVEKFLGNLQTMKALLPVLPLSMRYNLLHECQQLVAQLFTTSVTQVASASVHRTYISHEFLADSLKLEAALGKLKATQGEIRGEVQAWGITSEAQKKRINSLEKDTEEWQHMHARMCQERCQLDTELRILEDRMSTQDTLIASLQKQIEDIQGHSQQKGEKILILDGRVGKLEESFFIFEDALKRKNDNIRELQALRRTKRRVDIQSDQHREETVEHVVIQQGTAGNSHQVLKEKKST